jgi:hypothetical protein
MKCTLSEIEKLVLEYLKTNTGTMAMIALVSGIPQKDLCWIKRKLEKAGLLWEISKGACPVGGGIAAFLSTNPALKPPNYKPVLGYTTKYLEPNKRAFQVPANQLSIGF